MADYHSLDNENSSEEETATAEGVAAAAIAATSRAPRRTWEDWCNELKEFYEEHGHSRPNCRTLVGRWAAQQRPKKARHKLPKEQIRLLDAIQHDWETQTRKQEQRWHYMYNLLKEFLQENGHTRVKQKETYRGEALGNWVTCQQSQCRDKKLKSHRECLLDSIGFEWITCRQH